MIWLIVAWLSVSAEYEMSFQFTQSGTVTVVGVGGFELAQLARIIDSGSSAITSSRGSLDFLDRCVGIDNRLLLLAQGLLVGRLGAACEVPGDGVP